MKKLITLLLSLTMIFALCACGQTAEPKTEEPAKTDAPAADVAAADEPVTLRLYTRYSDEDNIKRIDYAVEKLKDEYPNVTIEIEAMPADDGVALKAMAATGDMPDIFSLSGTDLTDDRRTRRVREGFLCERNVHASRIRVRGMDNQRILQRDPHQIRQPRP